MKINGKDVPIQTGGKWHYWPFASGGTYHLEIQGPLLVSRSSRFVWWPLGRLVLIRTNAGRSRNSSGDTHSLHCAAGVWERGREDE
jgi:hypothetical protein